MGAGDVAAAPLVRAKPSLRPEFAKDIRDYTVTCAEGSKVQLSIEAPSGTRVRVGKDTERGGAYKLTVSLKPGQQVPVRVRSDGGTRDHHIRCLPVDFPAWTARRSGAPRARWYIVTPIVHGRPLPGYTVVFDRNGVPVWWMRQTNGSPYNASLLPDGGIAWIPYFATAFSIDKVAFVEHALDGSVTRRFSTVGSFTDHHELQVLPNGHAVLDTYRPRDHVNLKQLDPSLPSDATVVDGEIQEIDRAGKLVWSWSTKGHIALRESSRWREIKPQRLRDGRDAYDFIHLNSADMHGDRVVFSTRHTDAVYMVDKKSGAIVWKLGGTMRRESLRFADDPFGTVSFGGPHYARTTPDGRVLTLFDNGTKRSRRPRAVRYSIDPVTRTARLLESVSDPVLRGSTCCGSAQRLPGGHWAISWGDSSVVTESDSSGRRVLAIRFGDRRESYRVFPVLSERLKTSDFRRGMDAMAP